VSARHAVPVDQLAEVVWGAEPPPTGCETLQSHVSRLRRLLGAETIVMVDHAYLLDVAVEQVDALRFERLVDEAVAHRGQPETARDLTHEALGLWRGVPFGDLADEEPFRLEALRLDQLRSAAMELRIEADIALGRAELVVGALEAAVEESPYREHLWYLLIDALSAQERRVEALRTCDRLRTLLREVGLVPGEELRRREERIAGMPGAG
jgi:DNA-binding SARP family transcriptional activator